MTDETQTPADTVARIARAVPGVAGLHAGMFGEVATYLPGRRVAGVRVSPDHVDVHLIVDADAPVRDTAAAVRDEVSSALDGISVDVTVEDIAPVHAPPSTPGNGERKLS